MPGSGFAPNQRVSPCCDGATGAAYSPCGKERAATGEIERFIQQINSTGKIVGNKQGELASSVATLLANGKDKSDAQLLRSISLLSLNIEDLQEKIQQSGSQPESKNKINNALNGELGDALARLDIAKANSILTSLDRIEGKVDELSKQVVAVKQETSADPRKELQNLGVAWDRANFNKALEEHDARAVELFIKSGMKLECGKYEDRHSILVPPLDCIFLGKVVGDWYDKEIINTMLSNIKLQKDFFDSSNCPLPPANNEETGKYDPHANYNLIRIGNSAFYTNLENKSRDRAACSQTLWHAGKSRKIEALGSRHGVCVAV